MSEAERPGSSEPKKNLRKLGRYIKTLVSRHSQTPHEHNPDRPYPEENLIRHPLGGEVPAAELLDDVHASVRAAKIIDQDRTQQPEPIPLPEKEIPSHAFELVMGLQEAVSLWKVDKETVIKDDKILRDYKTTKETPEGDKTFFHGQLIYPDSTSKAPSFGNLSIVQSPLDAWPREYYFQTNPASEKQGGKPLIYYDDYPYHEEELGRPETNTVAALQKAKDLITKLPKTT